VIDEGKVSAVLLGDTWHEVFEGSFKLIRFGYGGTEVPESGFEFEERNTRLKVRLRENVVVVSGPLTAIRAVKYERASKRRIGFFSRESGGNGGAET